MRGLLSQNFLFLSGGESCEVVKFEKVMQMQMHSGSLQTGWILVRSVLFGCFFVCTKWRLNKFQACLT